MHLRFLQSKHEAMYALRIYARLPYKNSDLYSYSQQGAETRRLDNPLLKDSTP
jgi:hypothetical protein